MGAPGTDSLDLAGQRAGHAVLARFADLHAAGRASADGPVEAINSLASWAVGYLGEQHVGEQLGRLDGRWRVLHAVPLGRRGKDVDHLVVGPGGVFAINTKHHAGARASVKGGDALYLNGIWKPYLKDARRDARAVQDLLAMAAPTTITVRAVVCLVAARLTVTAQGDAVHVIDADGLLPWLNELPETISADLVDPDLP